MKNPYLTLIVFIVLAFAKAYTATAQQDFTAIAHYKSKMSLGKSSDSVSDDMKKMDPAMRKMIQNALADAGKAEFTLKFNRTESLYEKVQELAKPKPESGTSFQISFSGGGDTYGTTYKNLTEQTFLREDKIQGKEFLITDAIEPLDWKVTGETKKIGQYNVMKATYTFPEEEKDEQEEEEETGLLGMIEDEERVITAWFTMDIPVSNGPGIYQGLPGLILELNDGNTIILCDKIEMNPDKFEIKKPTAGKKISLEKFNKLQAKKQKEMEERFKRGGAEFIQFGG
jgi:GLPGLI family protein